MWLHDLAAQCARGLLELSPSEATRGRREDRVHAAPAVSCANCTKENAHEHTGSAETLRPSPRNGFTAYIALSLATGLSCHHRLAGLTAKLDASVGASGPHDFAVRDRQRSSHAALASTASHRAFVTLRNAPL